MKGPKVSPGECDEARSVPATPEVRPASDSSAAATTRDGLRGLRASVPAGRPVQTSPSTRMVLFTNCRYRSRVVRLALMGATSTIFGSVYDYAKVHDAVQAQSPEVLILDVFGFATMGLLTAGALIGRWPSLKMLGLLPTLRPRHEQLLYRSGLLGWCTRTQRMRSSGPPSRRYGPDRRT
jgi:hypothetical protein